MVLNRVVKLSLWRNTVFTLSAKKPEKLLSVVENLPGMFSLGFRLHRNAMMFATKLAIRHTTDSVSMQGCHSSQRSQGKEIFQFIHFSLGYKRVLLFHFTVFKKKKKFFLTCLLFSRLPSFSMLTTTI